MLPNTLRWKIASEPFREASSASNAGGIEAIEAAGGPVAYALAWIEDAAQDPAWKALQAQRRQGVLF